MNETELNCLTAKVGMTVLWRTTIPTSGYEYYKEGELMEIVKSKLVRIKTAYTPSKEGDWYDFKELTLIEYGKDKDE